MYSMLRAEKQQKPHGKHKDCNDLTSWYPNRQVDLVTLDLSFISVLKVLPAVVGVMRPEGAQMVVLIKPQFEAGRGAVSAGGVVRDPKVGCAGGLACQGVRAVEPEEWVVKVFKCC